MYSLPAVLPLPQVPGVLSGKEAPATPASTKGAAIAPIITTGKRIRTKRFIVIHQSLGSRRLIESCSLNR